MTLMDRIVTLAQQTLQDPRAATRALLGEGVPLPARTTGLLLIAVLSALLASLQLRLGGQALDPVTALLLGSPFRAAIFQWLFLFLSVVLIHRVGRAFGGRGSLADALLIVVWLQLLMLALQVLQLAVSLMSPSLAGIIGLASFALFFWLMASSIAELHGFASRGAVFAGMLATMVVAGLLIGIVLMFVIGPEAFQTYV
jgi:hypothetical protein